MVEKMSMLRKLGKSGITASDISSQLWCEKQMELNYMYGKRYTKAMSEGSKIHSELEEEVRVALAAEPITYYDSLYKIGYENYFALKGLAEKKIGREIRIYGSVNGYRLTGQIDELRIKNNSVVIIENKTKESGKPIDEAVLRPHRAQVMLYRKMLDDIRNGSYTYDNFANTYKIAAGELSQQFIKQLKLLGLESSLIGLEKIYSAVFSEIEKLPGISDRLEIHYIDRFTGSTIADIYVEYEKKQIDELLAYAMGYWNGEREAQPVPKEEKWKCNFCKFFGRECRVYS
jgi:exonuclease V